jgi:hypothetical protein
MGAGKLVIYLIIENQTQSIKHIEIHGFHPSGLDSIRGQTDKFTFSEVNENNTKHASF